MAATWSNFNAPQRPPRPGQPLSNPGSRPVLTARGTYYPAQNNLNTGPSAVLQPQNYGPMTGASYNYYAPPQLPRPPGLPGPITFSKPSPPEPPPPPGVVDADAPAERTVLPPPPPPPGCPSSSSNGSGGPPPAPVMNPDGTFAPLCHPPLPPLFPYLSQELAQSFQNGATAFGIPTKSFVEESADLPFVPVIIDDNDLKKMSETLKTQVEENRIKSLLLYEDIINPSWPKELRDMFQPLYCKLCKLTLTSPVVARDHYKGRKHNRQAEVWLETNPTKVPYFRSPGNTPRHLINPISGTVKSTFGTQRFNGPRNPAPPQRYFNNNEGSQAPPPSQYGNPYYENPGRNGPMKRNATGGDANEFIPAYRAALAGPSGPRKRPKTEGGGAQYSFCRLCNVHHTSDVTAQQHYAGAKHKAKVAAAQKETETNGQSNNQQ